MAIALVQSVEANISGGSTITLPAPPTVGNFLVMWQAERDYPGSWTPPAGFTLIPSVVTNTSDAFRKRGGAMAYREVQIGDDATYPTDGFSTCMTSLSEWSGIDAFYTSASQSNQQSATNTCGGSVTAPGGVDVLVIGGNVVGGTPGSSGDGSHALNPVAGTTELHDMRNNGNSAPRSWVGYKIVAAASGAYTVSGTQDDSVSRQYGGITAMFVAAAAGTPPVADFTGTPLTGVSTCNTAFTDASTNTPTSWAWTFGDGGTSTSQNPSHNYAAPGSYTVTLTATNASGSGFVSKGAYVVVTAAAEPGAGFEWDGLSFTNERVKEWTIQRGASPELTGGSQPGSMTIILINTPDDRYNPENTGGDLYGLLHDGIRTWVGINEDGTITADAAKDVYGLFAGRITDLSVIPGEGTDVAPFVEIVCEDQLGWMGRQKVTLSDSRTRSQADLRAEVLDALDEVNPDLPAEWTTMPLSSADGLALNILDNINAANGTRHFAKPADSSADWYSYTAVRRTAGLDGTSDAALSATDDHVTGTSGWRTSADGVINQQRASVDDIVFPVPREVWMQDSVPLTVTSDITLWAEFGDYVDGPVLETNSTGDALTATLTPFGDTAKIELSSAGTSVISSMVIRGRLVQRGSVASVVIDDLVSQAEPRGVRAGPDLTGDYLGILVSAESFANHIVWRFGNPLYRPTMTVENWFPEMFDLDLFDRIAFTSTQLGVSGRIFEIVGLTLHSDLAAGTTTPVVHHTATYVLQECRVQTPTDWFTLDTSELDGPDELMY